MIVDLKNLNCEDCPALYLRDKQLAKINRWETIREEVTLSIEKINLYLLGESIPANRFFYDKSTDYSMDGLRYFMRLELADGGSDDQLFAYLKDNGILLVDCALCPLHRLKEQNDKILGATFCLQRNTMGYLRLNPKA